MKTRKTHLAKRPLTRMLIIWFIQTVALIMFPNCPDILVNSFYHVESEEGCAFEELIGFHGGLGGLQTDPFVLHPLALKVPDGDLIGAASVHQLAKGWLTELQGESTAAVQ